MSPAGQGWHTSRKAPQPFVQSPAPEELPFLVPKTHISEEVKCCFPHLSTFKRAQVRQGVRSSTIQNATEPVLSWAPAYSAPAKSLQQSWSYQHSTGMGVCQNLHFDKTSPICTELFRDRRSSMVPANQMPSTSVLGLVLWLLLWACTTECLCCAGIPVVQDAKLSR